MVNPSYPGVYVQEVPSGVRTISGVSTSIAAFLGRASKGPIDKPVRLLSFSDYERNFGEPHPQSDLAHSVRMFFGNGGTDCYVVRLAPGAGTASVKLKALAADPGAASDTLVATAIAAGEWGNTIRLEVDYNTPNPDDSFNLRVIHEESGEEVSSERFSRLSMDPNSARFAPSFVSQSSELVKLEIDAAAWGDHTDSTSDYNDIVNSFPGYSLSRRPLRNPLSNPAGGTSIADTGTALDSLISGGQYMFDISVNGSDYVTVDLSAVSPLPTGTKAELQNAIKGAIDTALARLNPVPTVAVELSTVIAGFGRVLTITSTGGTQGSVRIRRAASHDIAGALMLGVDQGGIEPTRWSNFRPAPTASLLTIGDPATPGSHGRTDDLLTVAQNSIATVNIDGTPVTVNAGDYDIQTTGGADPWYQNKAGDKPDTGDNDGVREKLRIIANAINAESDLKFKAEVWGYHLALISTSNVMGDLPSSFSTGTADFDDAIVSSTRRYSLGQNVAGSFSGGSTPGTEGGIPDKAAYLGSASDQTGLHALDPVDLFNLLVLTGDAEVADTEMAKVWGPASVYCQSRRAFLLVDPPKNWTDANGMPAPVQDTSMINDLRAVIQKDHAAVFYPRLVYSAGGLTKTISPSGAIAGLMARTDANRGVWKAPAGIEAGLRSIIGLNVELTDAQNGVLNQKGVNCIRAFPNGIVNWGARTLDGDDDFGSEWKYVPVRRLALFIEESLYRGTRWVVFEPNDEPLWANIRLNVGAFMQSLFRQGAFQGSSPKEAFFVKCDKETTTQNDINQGIVNIRVGFAPLKPAEFVIITIQQMTGEL